MMKNTHKCSAVLAVLLVAAMASAQRVLKKYIGAMDRVHFEIKPAIDPWRRERNTFADRRCQHMAQPRRTSVGSEGQH